MNKRKQRRLMFFRRRARDKRSTNPRLICEGLNLSFNSTERDEKVLFEHPLEMWSLLGVKQTQLTNKDGNQEYKTTLPNGSTATYIEYPDGNYTIHHKEIS